MRGAAKRPFLGRIIQKDPPPAVLLKSGFWLLAGFVGWLARRPLPVLGERSGHIPGALRDEKTKIFNFKSLISILSIHKEKGGRAESFSLRLSLVRVLFSFLFLFLFLSVSLRSNSKRHSRVVVRPPRSQCNIVPGIVPIAEFITDFRRSYGGG